MPVGEGGSSSSGLPRDEAGRVIEPTRPQDVEEESAGMPLRVDRPRVVEQPEPQPPSEQERRSHELTHLPFQRWCEVCVRSQSVEDVHASRGAEHGGQLEDELPEIQFDFTNIDSMLMFGMY